MSATDANIVFLGHIDHHDPLLASAYAAARVLAMPSLFESPGLVALDAAMAGTPVVATMFGNTRDYFLYHVEYVDPRSVQSI